MYCTVSTVCIIFLGQLSSSVTDTNNVVYSVIVIVEIYVHTL